MKNKSRKEYIFERFYESLVESYQSERSVKYYADQLCLTPKLPVPVVYNCGGYESVETLRQLEGLVDIYLPDFKYSDDRLAAKLSAAPDYAETAAAAIREMYRQVGGAVIEDEQMTRRVMWRISRAERRRMWISS